MCHQSNFCLLVSAKCKVSCNFCVLSVYSMFGHHPHPLGYLCANFVSFAASIAELARGEKSHSQSINQSLSHSPNLIDAPGTEAFASECLVSRLYVRTQQTSPSCIFCGVSDYALFQIVHGQCSRSFTRTGCLMMMMMTKLPILPCAEKLQS